MITANSVMAGTVKKNLVTKTNMTIVLSLLRKNDKDVFVPVATLRKNDKEVLSQLREIDKDVEGN